MTTTTVKLTTQALCRAENDGAADLLTDLAESVQSYHDARSEWQDADNPDDRRDARESMTEARENIESALAAMLADLDL